jgi:hypothetical protein
MKYMYTLQTCLYICIDMLVVLNVETHEHDTNYCNLSTKPTVKILCCTYDILWVTWLIFSKTKWNVGKTN